MLIISMEPMAQAKRGEVKFVGSLTRENVPTKIVILNTNVVFAHNHGYANCRAAKKLKA